MAASKIATTMTIVDPFDELSDVAAANERLAAGLAIVSDRFCDALYGVQKGEEVTRKQLRDSWLLLELLREAHSLTIVDRTRAAESAFFEHADAHAIHVKVEALRAAA